MTKEEKTQVVSIIEDEIHKLTKKAEELKSFTEPISPDDAIGRISRMDAINNKSVFDASMRNIQTRLDQLAQALKMVKDADFGICIKCRKSIPFERLKIRPETRLCVNCLKK
ncbi:MAG: TraR/DksA C4-type zinc finger protein [Bacteroidales bacterium]|nr:TraR/DksA C4-type zinc finger protein [Bacteroidales bacterium]